MKLFEMKLDEAAIANGVDAISLVGSPAIESDFIALAKVPVQQFKLATVNTDKRIVMGAVLIPDKPILRLDEKGDPFHIYFKDDTIRAASELFLKRGYQNSTTLEHEVKLQGVNVVESWIVDDEAIDKTKLYNLDAPKNSWVVSMKIDNDEIWNSYVKTGKVKGFSIEGFFKPVEEKAAPKAKLKATILRKKK